MLGPESTANTIALAMQQCGRPTTQPVQLGKEMLDKYCHTALCVK